MITPMNENDRFFEYNPTSFKNVYLSELLRLHEQALNQRGVFHPRPFYFPSDLLLDISRCRYPAPKFIRLYHILNFLARLSKI